MTYYIRAWNKTQKEMDALKAINCENGQSITEECVWEIISELLNLGITITLCPFDHILILISESRII